MSQPMVGAQDLQTSDLQRGTLGSEAEASEARLQDKETPTPEAIAPAEEGSDDAPSKNASLADQPSAVVAIPTSARQKASRPSLWRRISLLGGRSGVSNATGDDRVLERLDAIEERIDASAREVAQVVGRLEERLSEVWEVEELISRLTDLERTLSEVRDRQGAIEGRFGGISRRLSFLVFVAATAGVAGLAAIALSLL